MGEAEQRSYQHEGLVVHWEASRCIHAAHCVRTLPAVFNPRRRPWIRLDQAVADAISAAVAGCPTGALHVERRPGEPDEPAPVPTTITVTADGPLYVHGVVEVRDGDDALLRADTRMALCRCGASRAKPYCDNSHFLVGFSDAAHAPRAAE